MPVYKPPGVYREETRSLPRSLIPQPTAVPAFVGHTRKAENRGASLRNKPWRISSLDEFERYFGTAPTSRFSIDDQPPEVGEAAVFSQDGKNYWISQLPGKSGGRYLLYYSMRLFFLNGGGACYVVSTGGYDSEISDEGLAQGLDSLSEEHEPTLLVIPEAVLLDGPACTALQQACLMQCNNMQSRFAILDVPQGHRPQQHPEGDCITDFRTAIGSHFLRYGAAYYPWLNTFQVAGSDVGVENIADRKRLRELLQREQQITGDAEATKRVNQLMDRLDEADALFGKRQLNTECAALSPLFSALLAACRSKLSLLLPAAAIAGIYTAVDNAQGVWKAPANVSLNAVASPAVAIANQQQDDLNAPPHGKAINAIRAFPGRGILVWGARTLAGNDNEWRYINVRRTLIMVEQTLKATCREFAFAANDADTWANLKNTAENFLAGLWRQGALAGTTQKQAFAVNIGLGSSMTSVDIANGTLRLVVMVAPLRPAEFMVIAVEQQLHTG